MLKQRVITAIIMIAIIGSGIVWLPVAGLAVLFAVMVLCAAWEWSALAGMNSIVVRLLYTALCAGLMVLIAWYCQLFAADVLWWHVRDILAAGCLWWAVALLWIKGYPASAVLWGSVTVRCLMGLFTLMPAWLALVSLRLHESGIALIFILVALVTSADIGAYFTGKAWGRAKLAPAVSPGKSWAGFWGGLVSSCLLAVLIWWSWDHSQFELLAVAVIAFATALASVLGDLLESMVKRHRGVKDSGIILPGHGGMMDRLDSMTAASPVFVLLLLLLAPGTFNIQ